MQGNNAFRWIPGMMPSADAIARMRARFSKPQTVTGEAWFMGEKREMYDELAALPLSEVSCTYLEKFLFEATSGKSSFGAELAEAEWKPWLLFLLPDLISRSWERYTSYLLEAIVTAFTVYFEDNPDSAYEGFQRDAILTLGTALMQRGFWKPLEDDTAQPLKAIPCFLVYDFRTIPNKLIGGRAVEGAFSAGMFFCLKYLKPADMASWVDSIIAIESPYWRAAFLNWLMGARGLLTGGSLKVLAQALPAIEWNHSFLLQDISLPLIPSVNANAFKTQIALRLSQELLMKWEIQLTSEKDFLEGHAANQLASIEWMFSEIDGLLSTYKS